MARLRFLSQSENCANSMESMCWALKVSSIAMSSMKRHMFCCEIRMFRLWLETLGKRMGKSKTSTLHQLWCHQVGKTKHSKHNPVVPSATRFPMSPSLENKSLPWSHKCFDLRLSSPSFLSGYVKKLKVVMNSDLKEDSCLILYHTTQAFQSSHAFTSANFSKQLCGLSVALDAGSFGTAPKATFLLKSLMSEARAHRAHHPCAKGFREMLVTTCY